METVKAFLLVGVGSFFGGGLRYLVSRVLSAVYAHGFPCGTFAVNVIGCFLLGLIYGWLQRILPGSETLKLLLAVGFCGGFTTFSTFLNENLQLLRSSEFILSAIYCATSLLLGLLAVYGGYALMSRL